MKGNVKMLISALLSAVILSSCALPGGTQETDGQTETLPVSDTKITETSADMAGVTETTPILTDTSPEVTWEDTETSPEDTFSELTETSLSAASAEETTHSEETASSEIITETEFSELLSSDTDLLTGTVTTLPAQVSETEPPAETVPPAEIVIPQIYTGNFNGTSTLENELASVDISDAANGVILVKYLGSCGKVKVRITKGSTVYDYDLDPSGTVFPLQSGSGAYNIKVLENVSGATYALALDMDFDAAVSNELSPFLIPTQFINFKSTDNCVYKAAELCAGKTGETDKVAAMFGYVTDNISYDKQLAASVKSGYIPSPDVTLSKGTGICFDYASLFAAMCRSQQIPAKLVMGYVRGNVYHAWNEIYIKETGWVTVDLFLGTKGWNLLDPTFYATAGDDKQEVSQYIGSGSDYSAVYYY